jgi:transcriptional regulator with XRE-family HTH domain
LTFDAEPPARRRLREWRLFRGLSQDELAELVGVSSKEIAGYEDGTRAIRMGMQFRLMTALKIKPAEFFEPPSSTRSKR